MRVQVLLPIPDFSIDTGYLAAQFWIAAGPQWVPHSAESVHSPNRQSFANSLNDCIRSRSVIASWGVSLSGVLTVTTGDPSSSHSMFVLVINIPLFKLLPVPIHKKCVIASWTVLLSSSCLNRLLTEVSRISDRFFYVYTWNSLFFRYFRSFFNPHLMLPPSFPAGSSNFVTLFAGYVMQNITSIMKGL